MPHLVIPDFQPVPFPAPLWLLKTLLVAGFYLHVLPMNVALGGALASGLYLLAGKGRPGHYAARIGHGLALGLPIFVSLAITQGIVPLLFLQLVYGPLYYTSSILMGTPWILLLLLLLTGYYGLYLYKLRHVQLGCWAAWLLIGVALLFGGVGFLFSNNMTLMLHPETWPAVVNGPSIGHGVGTFLNITDPTLLPRYLHFMLAALAVTGLAIGCYGLYWRKRDAAYGAWLIRQGSAWFFGITLLQIGIGGWFLMSLPKPVLFQFMGRETWGTASFMASLILSLLSLLATGVAQRSGKAGPFTFGMVCGLLVVLLMSVMRHLLREYSVGGFFHPEAVPVQPQWDLLIIFTVSAIGLTLYLGWLVSVVWKAFHPAPGPASARLSDSLADGPACEARLQTGQEV
jgi:hypothetical protein